MGFPRRREFGAADGDQAVSEAAAGTIPGAASLRRETEDAVALVILDRPASRNSLSSAMLGELIDAFAAIASDRAVRAVVLAAEGPAFCSGHDLKELTARRADPDGGRAFFDAVWAKCSTMMQAVVRLPQPVIACVQGAATAAGCQLVAACDLAVAAEGATFATPGVNIGLFCSTPMVALSRNVGRKAAMRMLLTGDLITAAEALSFDLVSHVVPATQLAIHTATLAEKIASKSRLTIAIGKEAFYRQVELPLAEAYAYASQVMTVNMAKQDAREGIDAFLEKRPPVWSGD